MITNGGDIWEASNIIDADLMSTYFKFLWIRVWGGNTSIGKEKDLKFDYHWAMFKGKVARATYFCLQPALTVAQNVERYKRVYPASDPGEIPEMLDIEIYGSADKSNARICAEYTEEYDKISLFLGHAPWIYTGRWYWDPLWAGQSTELAKKAEFVIASYYWYKNFVKVFSTYSELIQYEPDGWTTSVIGDTDRPIAWQWSGDQFTIPGKLGKMDFIKSLISVEDMITMRKGVTPPVVPSVPVPLPLEAPAYIELSSTSHALNVPFVSQLGIGSNKFNNDCGAACVSMLVSAYTQQDITVDEIYSRIQPNVDTNLSVTQIQNACAFYGINVQRSVDLSKEYYWAKMIEMKPSIALINYKPIYDAGLADAGVTFTGFHYVLVVGLDADAVLIHDPLYHKEDNGFRHIPFAVYDKAIRTPGAGVLLTATTSLGKSSAIGTNYKVMVASRLIRTGPDSSYSWIMSKVQGDIISIEEIHGDWGRLTGTTYWAYMPGLVKV